MKHLRKPTIPLAPWEIAASEMYRDIPVQNDVIEKLPTPISAPISKLVDRTFMGRLNVSDLDYMAKAILELLDKMHELQERVRILEAAKK